MSNKEIPTPNPSDKSLPQLADEMGPGEIEVARPARMDVGSMLRRIIDSGQDLEKAMGVVERLVQLHNDERAQTARQAYASAMNRVQSRIPEIKLRHWNKETQSKYAILADIHRTVKPIYTDEGFSCSIGTVPALEDGMIGYELTVMHDYGHFEKVRMDLPSDTKGPKGGATKSDVQGRGSSLSYARKYLEAGAFGISFERDDDGNRASGVQYITDDQIADLRAMLDELATEDKRRAVQWLKTSGYEKAESIPKDKFRDICRHIEGLRK